MEYLDIYDYAGRKTGKVVPRGTEMLPGEYFRSVMVALFRADGQVLIQQRTMEKKHWPGLWDFSCCGAVQAGEDGRQAAMREVQEELGLKLDLSTARANFVNAFRYGFNEVYLLEKTVNPEDLVLQREEVQQVCYATESEIHEMIRSGTFMPYRHPWVALLFETWRAPGTMVD